MTGDVKFLVTGVVILKVIYRTLGFKVLKRQDNNRNLVKFVNIADPEYKPKSHMGITYAEAMETIHAILPDGQVKPPMRVGLEGDNIFFHLDANTMSPTAHGNVHNLSHDLSSGDFRH